MGKNAESAVRLHSQEREWLLNLGNGSIREGVRNLVQQASKKQLSRENQQKGANISSKEARE